MTRSLWKGPFCEINWKLKKSKIWSRRSIILPQMLGQKVYIYNGKVFKSINIVEDMIGHKFGEFSSTRKKVIHKKKYNKN